MQLSAQHGSDINKGKWQEPSYITLEDVQMLLNRERPDICIF